MIIFLYGSDSYRSEHKLNEIIESYKKIRKSGLNLKFFNKENLNFAEFKNTFEASSMFGEKKLLVLRDTFSNKDFQERFLKEGKRFIDSDNIILFFEREKIDKKNPFYSFLRNNSKWQEFEYLSGQKLRNWAKKEFARHNLKTDSYSLELLLKYVGNDLWQLENEIEKLANYKNGETVKEKDIELLVKPKIENDIFKTIDSISEKKKNLAFVLLHQHLEKGDSPLYLLTMINFQFRNLILVKSQELKFNSLNFQESSPFSFPQYNLRNNLGLLAKKLKMHPYVIKKTIQQAGKFKFEELKKIYEEIFKTDLNIKTGKIESEAALDLLIAEI